MQGEPSDPSPRVEAARMFEAGVQSAEVARRTGVSAATVSRWRRRWREGGRAALLQEDRGGRRPRLTEAALFALGRDLARPPSQSGLPAERWSMAAVSALIQCRTGVTFHARHVRRVLRRGGWVVPPFGAHAPHALQQLRVEDPEGNPLLLQRRPRGG